MIFTTLLLVIKAYLVLLLSIGSASLLVFLAGLCFILRSKPPESHSSMLPASGNARVDVRDISAIAGDDVTGTQLDLAQAYIETGQLSLAKNLLESVRQQGNEIQQKEAQTLLDSMDMQNACKVSQCELH